MMPIITAMTACPLLRNRGRLKELEDDADRITALPSEQFPRLRLQGEEILP